MDLTAEQIAKILTNYKNKRQRENKYYHEVTKNKEDFKIKNRERAKAHYQNGYKEKKKENYNNNKDILKTKSLFNYYKKNNKIDAFKEKHAEKYDMLVEKGIIH
tara:strand:+ start:2585 stop:2896 length:312 start_codon:yes stop_codon:yes gene_type:complete